MRPPFTPEHLHKNRLYRQTERFEIAADDTTTGSIRVTANRGAVRAVQVRVAGGTDSEYAAVEFDIDDNGTKFLISDNLLAHSSSYFEDKPRTIPITIDENGVIGLVFRNSGEADTIRVIIVLLFWPPYDDSFRNTNL